MRHLRNLVWLLTAGLPLATAAAPGDVLGDLPAPSRTGTGLAFDGKLLWVADHSLDKLLGVDPASGAVRAEWPSPGHRPAGLAFDGAGLWNVDVLEKKIYRLRLADGLVERTIPSPVEIPRALAWDGEALWLGDDATSRLHRVDPTDGTTLSDLPFPGASVDALAWDGRTLWVADRLADRLYALERERGEVVVTLPSPGPHPTGLALDAAGLLRVLDYQTDRIATVRRDDAAFLVRTAPRSAWVVFSDEVRNLGPDPLATVDIYLAVPSDGDGQKLETPVRFEPETGWSEERDRWGQKVMHLRREDVAAGGAVQGRFTAQVTLWTLNYVVYPDRVKGLATAPAEVRHRYLADDTKFAINNPIIQQAVREAVGTERNPYWIARRLYRYVHEKLRYERTGGWEVAPKVLARGTGSCSEYSFVYIALCRAAGLPARFAGSIKIRRDDASTDDVFHRWVEVYLPPYGWVPVDPSGGDKPTEAERAGCFGHLDHDVLITTVVGGGSDLLDWSYNSNERTTCRGRCKVEVEPIAEWSPEDPSVHRPSPPSLEP